MTKLINSALIIFLMFGINLPLTSQKTEDKEDTSKTVPAVIMVTKENLPATVDSIKTSSDERIDVTKSKTDSLRMLLELQNKKLSSSEKKNKATKKPKTKTVYVEKTVVVKDTVYIEKERKSFFKRIFNKK